MIHLNVARFFLRIRAWIRASRSDIAALLVKGGVIGAFLSLFAGFYTLVVFGVMWLWNWLMPALFNLPTITAWQAFGLMVLVSLITGGTRVSRSSEPRRRSQ